MTHSGHASRCASAIRWARLTLKLEITSLRLRQLASALVFGSLCLSREPSLCQNVAVLRAGQDLPAGAIRDRNSFLSRLRDLTKPRRGQEPIVTFSCAVLRSGEPRCPCPLGSDEMASWRSALSQLHHLALTLLKVSNCAALTQRRNNGNNLQLSKGVVSTPGILSSTIQATPSNGARRRQITRPHHFKLAPLG